MNISKEQNAATGELVELIAAKIGEDRAIHPETAISASARLAGSFLLRSFNFDLSSSKPGDVLLSNEANEKGPLLMNIVLNYLSNSNIEINRESIGGEQSQRGEEPELNFLDSLTLLQDDAIAICEKYSLTLEASAHAAAFATAFVVKECSAKIGSEIAFNVAIYSFIEGSKTLPPEFREQEKNKSTKPWYKFG